MRAVKDISRQRKFNQCLLKQEKHLNKLSSDWGTEPDRATEVFSLAV